MQASARRLFDATLLLHKVDGHSEPGKVASLLGVSPASVTNWKSRGVSKEGAELAERKLGIRASWIRYGDEPMSLHLVKEPSASLSYAGNVETETFRAKVPLISWVQAGDFQGVIDVFRPGEAEEWVYVSETTPSDSTFALRVVGDSMVSPYPSEQSFPSGTVIIVDPARGAGPGDYVIAKDVQTQQATFKKLAHDGGRWFLKPLNPAYPTVEIDDPSIRIIGRVVEYQVRGKL